MSKYIIVWNEHKNEGVIFSTENNEDDAMDDAYHAGGGMPNNPCSTLADAFRETYGEDGDCHIEFAEINILSSEIIEKW